MNIELGEWMQQIFVFFVVSGFQPTDQICYILKSIVLQMYENWFGYPSGISQTKIDGK